MTRNDKMNILLVDDHPAKLLTYEAVLSDLGENLIKASSGMEALEKLLKNDVALVLMDVSMPGLDGFETAEMIHQHPRFEKTRASLAVVPILMTQERDGGDNGKNSGFCAMQFQCDAIRRHTS